MQRPVISPDLSLGVVEELPELPSGSLGLCRGGLQYVLRMLLPADDRLAAAARNQDAVIEALEGWIGRLARVDDSARFHRRLARILGDQEQTSRRTAEVGRRTLARRLADLSSSDAAALADVAIAQLELARRLERLLQEMDRSLDRSGTQAAAVALVIDEARRRAVAAEMRDAAERISRNHLGQAAAGQKRIARDLRAILDLAAKPGPSGTESGEDIGDRNGDRPKTPADGQAENDRPGTTPGTPTGRKSNDGEQHKPDRQRTRERMIRLWGELPPQIQEKLMQAPIEDFPPKYERLIEEYFRRLATGGGEGRGGEKND